MKIAILGATSQIAKDLICYFVKSGRKDLLLYVRNYEDMLAWLKENELEFACSIHRYKAYGKLAHDVVINFVGVGDPKRAAEMGAGIFEVTSQFDDMVLAELDQNRDRRYIFISSGAVYGNVFSKPVTSETEAVIGINDIHPADYYGAAKLNAEIKHRARSNLAIFDLRVFNIFSRTQDIEARFFITDIVRAIRDNQTLITSSDYMVRDFMHPKDFHQIIECLLLASPSNCAVDCYSRSPIDKYSLLQAMAERFGLRYEIIPGATAAINSTGEKACYYSLNRKAVEFGYRPKRTSLECILVETTAIVSGPTFKHAVGSV